MTSGTSPITYSVVENDADGSITSFNTSTRQVAVNIPSTPSTLSITYTAANSAGSVQRTVNFSATVIPPTTLVLPDPSNIDRTEGGGVYDIPLPAASGGTTPYTYSVLNRPILVGVQRFHSDFHRYGVSSWFMDPDVSGHGQRQSSAIRFTVIHLHG